MKTYKYRIYPNKTQEKSLVDTLHICKNLYNACLQQRIEVYQKDGSSISAYDQMKIKYQKGLNIKNIDDAYSNIRQQAILRLDTAFKNFFRRVKKGDSKVGFPRFKSVDRFNSFYYPREQGFKLTDDFKHIFISKIGYIKIKIHRGFEGYIKGLIVKRNGIGQWFVCYIVDEDIKPIPVKVKTKVGIDLGCINFAVLSNGEKIKHPHYYRKSEEKLTKFQSKYSKIKHLPREDKGKIKVKKQLNRIHVKIQNQRHDFLHKHSRDMVNRFDLICIEDLNVKSMTEDNYHNLNKSILDSGWNQFSQYLTYKAENAGKFVVKVNPAYTSQVCSSCGSLIKKELSDRVFTCDDCGLIKNRDVNASLNILSLGTKLFKQQCLINDKQ